MRSKIPSKNVTDSSLDSLQIDENRCQKLHKKLLRDGCNLLKNCKLCHCM